MELSQASLTIENLTKSFGALLAVNGVNLSVAKGESRAIIGPNGAGKTTLFNLISGTLKPTAGQILFKGEDIATLPPYEICKRGVVRTFQITHIFPDLSVLENVRLAVQFKQGGSTRILGGGNILRQTRRRGEEVLASLGLSDVSHHTAAQLSHGDQRLLELGMAIAQDPEVLLLDEPTAGLSAEETHKAVELINIVSKKRETATILVEHDMDVVFDIADQITVLNFGQIIAEGSKEEIQDNEEVQLAYLGGLQ
jgi:branched-chain amino acid transport system ATP-binding protein